LFEIEKNVIFGSDQQRASVIYLLFNLQSYRAIF